VYAVVVSSKWRISRIQPPEDGGTWMTRPYGPGWRLDVRLIDNGYRTVIDQLHLVSTEPTLYNARGVLELPTDSDGQPDWTRITLRTVRREATEGLREQRAELRQEQQQRFDQAASGTVDPTGDRREQLDHILAMQSEFNIFTNTNIEQDRDLRLALVAAAYEQAQVDDPTHPRSALYDRLGELGLRYAPSSVGPLVYQSRKAGMLTSTQNRAAAGKTTPKARKIIRNAEISLPWTQSR
jgi:hypothetical protein